MSRKLKYFKKFLDDPASFPNGEFYRKIREWIKYIEAHKDEFDYLKDDEWKEIRERVLAELEKREDVREEFEIFNERLKMIDQFDAPEKGRIYRKWLAFMRKNKFEFEFTDEQLNEYEAHLKYITRMEGEHEILRKRLRVVEIEKQKSLEKLDDELFEYYERTGKRLVLTSLRVRKKNSGN